MNKPIFKHDCDQCLFVPKSKFHDPKIQATNKRFKNDVYICTKSGYPTMVMRYGNDGPDYVSTPINIETLLKITGLDKVV